MTLSNSKSYYLLDRLLMGIRKKRGPKINLCGTSEPKILKIKRYLFTLSHLMLKSPPKIQHCSNLSF